MFGSLQACHTLVRGAATKRTNSRSNFGSDIFNLLQQCIKAIETGFPERALFRQPPVGGGKCLLLDCACPHTAFLTRQNPSAVLEKSDVLHEGRQRHIERLRQFADACGALAQPPQHGSARGVGERLEEVVQSLLILFHKAKYRAYHLAQELTKAA